MDNILFSLLKWAVDNFIINIILQPLFDSVADIAIDGTVFSALHVDEIFTIMRTVGFAILTLVVLWQALKSMFGFTGLEVDEPSKLIFKTIIMGVALGYSKDILMWGTELSTNIIGLFSGTGVSLSSGVKINFVGGLVIEEFIKIYLGFKLIGILIRMIERTVLNGFLIIGAPLAFAAGVSQPTKGFFQGFIKVYVGNLVVMVLQNLGVQILFAFILDAENGLGSGIVHSFVAIAIIKVIGKLEDIVRDMSIGVGVGRDMGSALQTIQSAAYSGPMVVNAAKSIFKGG